MARTWTRNNPNRLSRCSEYCWYMVFLFRMRLLITALLILCLLKPASSQVDVIASTLGVKFQVLSNSRDGSHFSARITLTNHGDQRISQDGWELHYMSMHMLQPEDELWKIPAIGSVIRGSRFRLFHIKGCLFKFVPTSEFSGIRPGENLVIDLTVGLWSVAKSDNLPNWYLVDSEGRVSIVASTATENLDSFTGSYDTPSQLKRSKDDHYSPWTLEERWDMNEVSDLGTAQVIVIPTPTEAQLDTGKAGISIPLSGWSIYVEDAKVQNEANLLKEKLRLDTASTKPSDRYISLTLNSNAPDNPEGYLLVIDGDRSVITITARTSAGVYYGCQTLVSIIDGATAEIGSLTIQDYPRFAYRGMLVDVARHFVPYEDMVKLIKTMGMYKLNKLHFHLTDDEGWRIEMPWCSFLTTVGATQCHDEGEDTCLYPQFGSKADGSDRGSGYYTRQEYQRLLRLAQSHHIEVIPEVDLPGHSRAAIKATQAYLKSVIGTDEEQKARNIQLSERTDTSSYLSMQMYTDSATNPCLDSTYQFISKLLESFIEYHHHIQPLKVFHLGGDEVPLGAWVKSEACSELIMKSNGKIDGVQGLKEYFVQRASEVARRLDKNLTLGLWEDGAMTHEHVPFDLSGIATDGVLVNSWKNLVGDQSYKLANAGYKVVLSHATHLYFDHPQEPDPEERGLYWATRYTNTRKTFGFTPDNLNAKTGTSSEKHLENIIGMQGHIWTETMRTSDQFFGAVFPRLLALAERAWHKASWEDLTGENKETQIFDDWTNFANTLGYKEFRRLDKLGVPYRVPVAGAKMIDDKLILNAEFPGLEMLYSTSDDPNKWSKYTHPLRGNIDTYLQIRSSDGSRGGRIVKHAAPKGSPTVGGFLRLICVLLSFCFFSRYLVSVVRSQNFFHCRCAILLFRLTKLLQNTLSWALHSVTNCRPRRTRYTGRRP